MCIPLAPVPVFPKPEPVVLCHLLFLDDPYYIQEKLAYEKSDLLREHAVEEVPEVELTEAQKIALMGRPRLGDQCRCTVRIKESKEFKNTVDKLFQKANVSLMIGTSSWKEQFIEALTVVADYWGGWACFVTSILLIGVLTAFVGDLASHFGCTIGLKDSTPFASKVAAQNDKYADSSIGNVTGSNAVNVFLGIGVAWSLAALVHWGRGTTFEVLPGNLAFSVTIFCVCALLCCVVLLMRRNKIVGGELGGPMRFKLPTTILFGGLWVFYVTMSALEAYGVVQGF
ncbi:hypothetical protein HPB51_016519 [Rhipicephalus microplus]|uniref:Sodium/calcium exchanger membrane region domain-containing protein n=1 Tax=Rhipicephalus microplus TaxID=6941 RepID=A0A9J6E289_RHIMP|nr:hypothetical protein HPB51_016519 [Rhipicephalus microplus]